MVKRRACCEHGNGMSCTAEQLSTFHIIQYNVTLVNDSRILIYQLQEILEDCIWQTPEGQKLLCLC
jgi:hypothetical protein